MEPILILIIFGLMAFIFLREPYTAPPPIIITAERPERPNSGCLLLIVIGIIVVLGLLTFQS